MEKRTNASGGGLVARVLKTALAVLLAVMLVPVAPVVSPVAAEPTAEKAWADDSSFAGTTNYSDLFTWGNRYGSPARTPSDAGRLRAASTETRAANATSSSPGTGGDWGYASNGTGSGRISSSTFITRKAVSLANSWTVSFDTEVSRSFLAYGYSRLDCYAFIVLSTTSSALNITGPAFVFRRLAESSGTSETLKRTHSLNGVMSDTSNGSISVPFGEVPLTFSGSDRVSTTIVYDHNNDRLTATASGRSLVIDDVKKVASKGSVSSLYLAIGGYIRWDATSGGYCDPPFRDLNVAVTFDSFSLPHLSPAIEELTLYRGKTSEVIGKDGAVTPGEVVRVECTVRNTHSQAGSEQFPMHLKTISTDQFPTQGLTLLRNSTYPVTVGGKTVAVDIDSADGVPLTLSGGTAVKVVYYAKVSGPAGGAVSVGQQLIEDSFGGTKETGTLLVNERPLEGAPDTVDPDNPGTTAGTAFHYARFPQANPNGWNNSPVTVRFYPGDFDQMELTPSGGSAVTLREGSTDWVQSADTASTELAAQAKNTATGALSTQRAGTVKIDSTVPRLDCRAVVGELDIDDSAAVSSGVWRLHRTGSSGIVAADARAAAWKTFPLSGGNGSPTARVTAVPNGWYVAEDAAGNLSVPVKVSTTEPPSVERPAGSVVDPDDPNPPSPVGPPITPGDDVPEPTVTEDDDALKHAVINETVSEMIDMAAPPFGGLLEKSEATAMMDYRYAASSAAGVASVTDELLDAAGNPITAFDTKAPGECLVRRIVTDSQGNTTTINLTYRLTRDNCPSIRPLQPVDPDDPTGPAEPGDPLMPTSPVVTDPDGTQHTETSCEITEAVTHGTMGVDGAETLLRRHFDLSSVDGGIPTLAVQFMEDVAGNRISAIDLSRVADYLITYLVRDGAGNTTTVRMGYHLIASHVPGVVVTPEPGDGHDPLPGEDPLHPKPRPLDPTLPPKVAPDGTQHADVHDTMQVKVQEGGSLSLADARSLVQRRYVLTPEGGGSVTELSLGLADASGTPVTTIDLSRPGAWNIAYKVADASGNTVTVHLRYLVVADSPSVTPTDPDGGDTPENPDDPPGGRDPLPPTSVVVDPETGLTHAVIEDTVTVPTADERVSPAAMAELLASRYKIASGLSDGLVERSAVSLWRLPGAFGALATESGLPLAAAAAPDGATAVAEIDRSAPGDWLAVQTASDSAGNTTEIRLTYLVREGSANGSLNGGSTGGSGNDGDEGAGRGHSSDGSGSGSGGDGHKSWSSRIHELPQTGGILGPCPLHPLFLLVMLASAACALARCRRRRAAAESGAEATDRRWRTAMVGGCESAEEAPRRPLPLPGLPMAVLCSAAAVALGALAYCEADWLWAAATVIVALVCACFPRRR